MTEKYATFIDPAQDDLLSSHLAQRLQGFLAPLTRQLHSKLDARLLRTFIATIVAIICFRELHQALLLSQLGAFLMPPHQAPAGTKRLSNLIHSPNWSASLVQNFLWRQATLFIRQLKAAQQMVLVIWDDSVIEKIESRELEGLCSVRSSKAARLKKVKKGFYTPPPGPPIFVPGMQWSALIVSGLASTIPPFLGAMHWWTTRGQNATDRRTQQGFNFQDNSCFVAPFCQHKAVVTAEALAYNSSNNTRTQGEINQANWFCRARATASPRRSTFNLIRILLI